VSLFDMTILIGLAAIVILGPIVWYELTRRK